MSIQSEISRIAGNIASAYTALSAKGATMPSVLNTANLKSTIESIEMMTAEAMSIETIWEICGWDYATGLPSGYTLLEYIQSTGTQYIDTGFSPNQDTRVVCKAQYTDTSGGEAIFGCRYSTASQRYEFLMTASVFYSSYNTGGGSSTTASAGVLEIDKNKNTTTLNGVAFSTHTYAAFQCPCNLLLFSDHTNGTPNLQAQAKIYYFKIYDNGTLVRDFVPCINASGAYGLYDKVNKKFYGNAGSGAFTGG